MKKSLYVMSIGLLLLALPVLGKSCGSSCQTACQTDSCSSSCSDSCECMVTDKTFLSIRPFFEAASPAKVALVRHEMDELRCGNGSLFQVVPFGGKTMKPWRLGQYFGPSCKQVLNVTEQQADDTDILSAQLGIVTTSGDFVSKFTLNPEQTFAGVGLNYRTHFGCGDENKGFFIDLTLPVYYVRNTVNLCETIINDGGGAADSGYVDSVAAAFQQSSWCFGRIDDCNDTTHVGVSELDIQIGYGWGKEQAFMHSYIGVIVPTGNRVKGHKVFEPIIGWNHNTAIHFGSTLGIELWHSKCKNYDLRYEFAIDSRYFFENTQYRSFNLKNKPWSRYMVVYSNLAQATLADTEGSVQIGTPGINLFTQKVKVQPRFQRTYNTAFALDLDCWLLEGGYNFFTRDEECVRLACPWSQVAGITFERNDAGALVPTDGPALKSLSGLGYTDSVQQIGNQYALVNRVPVADYATNIILEDDLDLSSAQAPCLLSQRLYGAVGYTLDTCWVRTLFGLGAEYEFAGDNAGINRWGVWGKIAFIF